jgi:hypothetical protein
MGFTVRDIEREFVVIAATDTAFKLAWKARNGEYHIRLKRDRKYVNGQETFNQLVALFENKFMRKFDWKFFDYTIFDNCVKLKTNIAYHLFLDCL